MLTFSHFISESNDFKSINLGPHTKGMKKYSHGDNHVGYHDPEFKSGVTHKKLHSALVKAGYRYHRKDDGRIGGKDVTYHLYHKPAGPYADHHLHIITPKGSGKVQTVEHKTIKDNS